VIRRTDVPIRRIATIGAVVAVGLGSLAAETATGLAATSSPLAGNSGLSTFVTHPLSAH
jgi:hypothetical protein